MGNSKVDKSEDFLNSGMRLITETDADGLLEKARKEKKKRLSRLDHFDDFLERWAE
jgi:hypothetical protein